MNDVKISKFISLVLRHKPSVINTTLTDDGYCNVDVLIKGVREKFNIDFTLQDLERIVAEDNKQRYSFKDNMIRANQGHSINVDLGLKEKIPNGNLFHGTARRFKENILKEGITRQSRQYVHLSGDINTAINVGKRHGEPMVLVIDAKAMYEDGYKFYLSENGVWLTDYVPVKYIKRGY